MWFATPISPPSRRRWRSRANPLPRLHSLGTGDELAEPGTARERADVIPESVSLGVSALAEQWGAECLARTRLRDDLASMVGAAESAVDAADIVVVTGGASVG